MDPIKEAFLKIKNDINQIKEELFSLKKQIKEIKTNPTQNTPYLYQQTDTQTHNQAEQAPYGQNIGISTGNRGVPTDRPTHQQTDISTHFRPKTEFERANEILSSLDSIKKGIRLKFKRLTTQEMLVFSTLYSLEEQNIKEITYKTLAQQLTLSESSIRDYINKLIQKGVPIDKTRQNNKTILLNISQNLKNIATLATIQDLREL
jgi:biotin operon repressor